MAKINFEITDEDLKEVQDGLEIVGTDEVAKFQILSQTLMNKVDDVLEENFENLPILETLDEILDKLEDADILRTKENIYISDGVSVDFSKFSEYYGEDYETEEDEKHFEAQRAENDLKGYVFRIPATWAKEDDEKRLPILISGGICNGNITGSHEFEFYIASHSVEEAEIAEKFILSDLQNPEDHFKIAQLAIYVNNILFGEIPIEITNKKQKTFFKVAKRLAKKYKFEDLMETGGIHVYLDEDCSSAKFLIFENLSLVDKLIKRIVKYIHAEEIPLTDEDLAEILAIFNYKNSDEWIEEMLKVDNILQFPSKN